jgi:Cell wall-associated hydrolases (invasion-associated proteins)
MPLSFIDPPRPPRIVPRLWVTLGILLIVAFLLPFRFGLLRLGIVGGAFLFWAGALYLAWSRPVLRAACALPGVLLALLALLPSRPVNIPRLRTAYLESLESYEGSPYLWGGETRLGIDCSGLVRRGMIDAFVKEGVRTANPGLLREAAALWWFDCSAEALGKQYQGWTAVVAEAKSLNELDYSRIAPGDIAVTASGIHTLAYLGDRTWIQADPQAKRVVTVTAPSQTGWFVQKVRLVRWHPLADAATSGSRQVSQAP